MSEETSQKQSGKKMQAVLVLLLVLSLAGNAFLGSMFWQTRGELKQLQDGGQITDAEVQEIIDEVSKLIALPEGETPTVATVSDAENLKARQPFFAAAVNGDKVLLYANAEDSQQRKAYLYRPSTKQLLNVAPIQIGGNQVQQQQDEFSMEIRNGTETAGLEDRMENLLVQVFPNSSVPTKGEAANDAYESSVLVQVNASDELTEKVSSLFNVQVVELPAGETDPGEVDLLLILGGTQPEGDEADSETQVQPTTTPTPAAETEGQ